MSENVLQFAWFRAGADGAFEPEPLAASLWSAEQMHGVAVSALLAREVERSVDDAGRSELVPARWRVDLFRPAKMVSTRVEVEIVRSGPRLLLLDARLVQGEVVVARASATFLASSVDPEGRVWSADDAPQVPPIARPEGEGHVPFFASAAAWSDSFADHQNAGRHQTWQAGVPVLVGEACTPFCAVAAIGDAASMVTNWGDAGVQHINVDIDLALVRRPVGTAVGLRSTDHVRHAGLAVGTAEVFDRAGVLGAVSITALSNARRTVDLSGPNPEAGGTA